MENLLKENIVPEIIDEKPAGQLKIKYNSGVQVDYGNELTPTQVKDEPVFEYPAEGDKLYTIAFVDPDAPSRADPKFGQCLHYMVHNVPGLSVGQGNVAAEFIGSGPPEGTGLHRYIFVVYEQPGKIVVANTISKTSIEGRMKFKLRDYATEKGLGKPIAANFYLAQYDDYVPLLHKQFAKI